MKQQEALKVDEVMTYI